MGTQSPFGAATQFAEASKPCCVVVYLNGLDPAAWLKDTLEKLPV